ncbi:MAG: hypothetical protein HUK15_02875 [Bacteroidales bacterium]|nr:hypothetical protein [Bacteroidales bacterium]
MKKFLLLAIAVMALTLSGCIEESYQYLYSFGADFEISGSIDHTMNVLQYVSDAGIDVNEVKILEGSEPTKCDKEAKVWFDTNVSKINEKEFCESILEEGEYYNLRAYRLEEGKEVVIAEKEFKHR